MQYLHKSMLKVLRKWVEDNKDRATITDYSNTKCVSQLWLSITDGKYTGKELESLDDDWRTYELYIEDNRIFIYNFGEYTEYLQDNKNSLEDIINNYKNYNRYARRIYESKNFKEGFSKFANIVNKSGYFTPFPSYTDDTDDKLCDFIYKIDESKTLKVTTNYSSIQEYFDADYIDHDSLDINAIGIDESIMSISKVQREDGLWYSFHVSIVADNDESFIIHTTFKTIEEFKNLLTKTIDYIKDFKGFEKYVEDLQNCL